MYGEAISGESSDLAEGKSRRSLIPSAARNEMCGACEDGPFCPDHCFKSHIKREQNICTICYRDRAKVYKYADAVKKSNDNPKIGEWLKNHPNWESEQKEIYMRKAEEKWGYVRAVKVRMELRK